MSSLEPIRAILPSSAVPIGSGISARRGTCFRPRVPALFVLTACLAGLPAASSGGERPLVRPPLAPPAILSSEVVLGALPLAADPAWQAEPSSDAPSARWVNKHEPGDLPGVILFAGASLQLTPPAGWQIWELPSGREVRLVISNEAPHPRRRLPPDCLWVVAHARAVPAGEDAAQLTERFAGRLLQFEGPRCRIEMPRVVPFGNYTAFRHDFHVLGEAADALPVRSGFQLVISTPWAYYEIHATAPAEVVSERRSMWEQTLHSLRVQPPSRRHVPQLAETEDAAAILGSWKAYRSRLRLSGDGHVSLHFDPPTGQRLDMPLPLDAASDRSQPTEIHGTFQAQGDLLLVTWADGSKLNFRWRTRGEDLLMTDHNGRISQLRKLLE